MSPRPFTTAVKLDKTDALETSPSFFFTISPLAVKIYYYNELLSFNIQSIKLKLILPSNILDNVSSNSSKFTTNKLSTS